MCRVGSANPTGGKQPRLGAAGFVRRERVKNLRPEGSDPERGASRAAKGGDPALGGCGSGGGPRAERGRGRRGAGAGCADLGRWTEQSDGARKARKPGRSDPQPRSRGAARDSALRSAPAGAGQRCEERPRAVGCGGSPLVLQPPGGQRAKSPTRHRGPRVLRRESRPSAAVPQLSFKKAVKIRPSLQFATRNPLSLPHPSQLFNIKCIFKHPLG